MKTPKFDDAEFLRQHVLSILSFYEPNVFDSEGGFFQHFKDDGSIYDHDTRHLVSSTRFVFNYVNAYQQTGKDHYKDWAKHGFDYLKSHHLQGQAHYIWQRNKNSVEDGRAMAYGHAFVILAAAYAAKLGIDGAAETIEDVWQFMEDHFWEDQHHAYADEKDSTLTHLDPYRGQNANMHSVEALIAAFEVTKSPKFLSRAENVATQFCITLADQADGQIWEHYDKSWQHDWTYNIDKPDDLFKPWGFQPGHQVEWSKLLLQLDGLAPKDWYLPKAKSLFDTAMAKGWDQDFGGLVYGYAPDGKFADAHKYFWVQAEAIATAWRLWMRTDDPKYLEDYRRLWQWSWDHLIDHQHGAWFRIVSREGKWIEPWKSPAGKVDYHTMGACWDVLSQMKSG